MGDAMFFLAIAVAFPLLLLGLMLGMEKVERRTYAAGYRRLDGDAEPAASGRTTTAAVGPAGAGSAPARLGRRPSPWVPSPPPRVAAESSSSAIIRLDSGGCSAAGGGSAVDRSGGSTSTARRP